MVVACVKCCALAACHEAQVSKLGFEIDLVDVGAVVVLATWIKYDSLVPPSPCDPLALWGTALAPSPAEGAVPAHVRFIQAL